MTTTLLTDRSLDSTLRPNSFDSFIGNTEVKRAISIFQEAARRRNEPLGHVCLDGPSGCGKTTLAGIMAHATNKKLHVINCANVERMEDIIDSIISLEAGDFIFCDEAHALSGKFQEGLYHAIESGVLNCTYKGQQVNLNLPPFTMVIATTRQGLLTKPFLNRFEVCLHLQFYEVDELATLLEQSCRALNITAERDALIGIAKRSRGTPRTANVLLKRSRDYADVEGNGNGIVELAEVNATMSMLGIDNDGLDALDRAILRLLANSTRPIGIRALASSLQEDLATIENAHEPWLCFSGFVSRLANGRTVTEKGRKVIA